MLGGRLERALPGRALRFTLMRRLPARFLAAGASRIDLGRLPAGRYRLRAVLADRRGNRRPLTLRFRPRSPGKT